MTRIIRQNKTKAKAKRRGIRLSEQSHLLWRCPSVLLVGWDGMGWDAQWWSTRSSFSTRVCCQMPVAGQRDRMAISCCLAPAITDTGILESIPGQQLLPSTSTQTRHHHWVQFNWGTNKQTLDANNIRLLRQLIVSGNTLWFCFLAHNLLAIYSSPTYSTRLISSCLLRAWNQQCSLDVCVCVCYR